MISSFVKSALFRDHPAAAVLIETSGHQILAINQKALSLFGKKKSYWSKKNINEFLPGYRCKKKSEDLIFNSSDVVARVNVTSLKVKISRKFHYLVILSTTSADKIKFDSFTVDHVQDIILWSTQNARLLNANPAASRQLGYSHEELMKMSISDFDLVYTKEIWPQHWEELRTKESMTFESTYRRRDGSIFSVEIKTSIIEYHGTEYNCAIVRDISERRRIEQALIESEERLRNISENIPSGAFYQILVKNGTRKVNFISSGIEQIIGISPAEIYEDAHLLYKSIHPDDFNANKEAELDSLRHLTVFEAEERILHKSGQVKWVHVRSKPRLAADNALIREGFLIDITDRKLAEVKLAEREAQVSALANNVSRGAIYQYQLASDGSQTFTYFSNGIEAIAGIKAHEIVADPSNLFSLIHPEDQGELNRKRKESAMTVMPLSHEFRLAMKGGAGGYKWISLSSMPVKKSDGTLIWNGILMDITAQREVADDLRAMLNASTDGIVFMDKQGRIRIVNRAGIEGIKAFYTSNDFVGKRYFDILPEHLKQDFQRNFEKALQGEEIDFEREVKFVDRTLWLRIRYNPVLDNLKQIIGVSQNVADITARRAVEEEIKQSEQRFRFLYNRTPVMLHSVDSNGLLIRVSDFWLEKMGYAREEVVGMPIINFLSEESRKIARSEMMPEFFSTGNLTNIQYDFVTKSGKIINTVLSAVGEFNENGQIVKSLAVVTDISELQKTNQELDHFVYSVSHDLRAPLASILGLVKIAEFEKPSENVSRFLSMIRDSVNRLDGFIRDILNYSRNSRKVVEFEKIDFQLLLNEVQDNLRSIGGFERIEFNTTIYGGESFYSDRYRIAIILNNLVSNAVKYQDLLKPSSFVKIAITVTPKEATIIFVDNGIGIAKPYLGKIFDMFFRATEEAKGSGLGLYICKETVNKLKGTISVNSELGVGTTFEISIPNFSPSNPLSE